MKNKLLEKIHINNIEMFDFFKKLSQELYENIDLSPNNAIWEQKINKVLNNNNVYTLFEDVYFVKNKDISYLNCLIFCKDKKIISLKFNKKEFHIDDIIIGTNISHLSVLHSQNDSLIYDNTDNSDSSEISFFNKSIDQDMIEIAKLKYDIDISGLINFNMTPLIIEKEDGINLLKNYTSEEKIKTKPKVTT